MYETYRVDTSQKLNLVVRLKQALLHDLRESEQMPQGSNQER